tara:strand:- start:559 stop:771 length:213 start_codon:yes stop_codon:yes gene_type:complete
MRAISFNTEAEALQRSKDEAYSRGCDENTTTQYWWAVSQATDDSWCCWIRDDQVDDEVSEKEQKTDEEGN